MEAQALRSLGLGLLFDTPKDFNVDPLRHSRNEVAGIRNIKNLLRAPPDITLRYQRMHLGLKLRV